MFFALKKYTILHPHPDANYELPAFNQIFTSQSYPSWMGCGSGMDLHG